MPLLSALRTLAVGSLLGPQKERDIDWYLEPRHLEKLLNQLRPHLDKIAQTIQHYAISVRVLSLKPSGQNCSWFNKSFSFSHLFCLMLLFFYRHW